MVYFSQDTHYSVVKILRVLKARNIMIKSQENGEIDYDDLHETIRINRDVPVIFMANIGTTMKGAIDDVSKVREILDDLGGDKLVHSRRRGAERHDLALRGRSAAVRIRRGCRQRGGQRTQDDRVSPALRGSPSPSASTWRESRGRSNTSGVLDTTLTGSRNALTPLMMWYALRERGFDGYREAVTGCLDVAEYAVTRFNDSGIPAWRNKNSVTVVFSKPSAGVVRKWQLAPYEDIAHLIAMPHVTREIVDAVVDDCLKDPE